MKVLSCLCVAVLVSHLGISEAKSASDPSGDESKPSSKPTFGMRSGLHWGTGKMKAGSTIPERTMNTLGAQILPGYYLGDVLVGPFFEYRIVGQNTEPLEVNNQNIKGNGMLLGLGASYDYKFLNFAAAFTFFGQHSLDRKDSAGLDVDYQKPIGIHLLAGYRFNPMFTGDVQFSTVSYREDEVGLASSSTISDVSTNKRTHWDLAIGASFHYDLK